MASFPLCSPDRIDSFPAVSPIFDAKTVMIWAAADEFYFSIPLEYVINVPIPPYKQECAGVPCQFFP